MSSQNQLNKIK